MVACAAQRLAFRARRRPTGRGKHEKKLFVGSPCKPARDPLGAAVGVACHEARDRDVGPGRFYINKSHASPHRWWREDTRTGLIELKLLDCNNSETVSGFACARYGEPWTRRGRASLVLQSTAHWPASASG